MNAGCCCEAVPRGPARESIAVRVADLDPRPPAARRSYLGIAGWAVPGAILALMPKCPACLAAYVAIGTGVALSASAAAYLRMTLVILCLASLSYAAAGRLRLFPAGRNGESRRARRGPGRRRRGWSG
jgi:hypothetical protein